MSGGIVNGSRAGGQFSLRADPIPDTLTLDDLESMSSDFGGWLDRRMKDRNASYRRVAAYSGLDASTVLRLRRGDRQPTLDTAVRLIRALGR